MRAFLKIALCLATAAMWMAFLCLDSQWNSCLTHAVTEGKKTYGEMYGPLAFFRPVVMYSALSLSLICGAWLAVSGLRKPPLGTGPAKHFS
jgi:hypothetical protein